MEEKKNEIILFENQGVKLEVNLKDETVWLNLEQIAELFERDKSVVSRHIKNALAEELKDEQVVAKFATTTKHGAIEGKTQTHMVDYYNLDMIISVGYRVKSKNGIIFRKWATKVLKDYMLQGYAVNQRRLEYLVVKNHVFIDGNKRIAATLFIYFLNYYGILYKDGKQIIDNNTLAALTLLIAESNPKEKEIIIDLVMNFLEE